MFVGGTERGSSTAGALLGGGCDAAAAAQCVCSRFVIGVAFAKRLGTGTFLPVFVRLAYGMLQPWDPSLRRE